MGRTPEVYSFAADSTWANVAGSRLHPATEGLELAPSRKLAMLVRWAEQSSAGVPEHVSVTARWEFEWRDDSWNYGVQRIAGCRWFGLTHTPWRKQLKNGTASTRSSPGPHSPTSSGWRRHSPVWQRRLADFESLPMVAENLLERVNVPPTHGLIRTLTYEIPLPGHAGRPSKSPGSAG